MRYRGEIDGLRAVAVVPVILFHAGYKGVPGGFLGVDIFFVISGYLITSIIQLEISSGQFSLVSFYERRARRILPALFSMLLFCLTIAWFQLAPADLKKLGNGAAASVAFAANIYLYLQRSDYFGSVAEENPILHLWSLAVEEQFYIIFPFMLVLMWRWGRDSVFKICSVLLIISFVFAFYAWHTDPVGAFYLLPSRSWELLVGCVLAVIPQSAPGFLRKTINSAPDAMSFIGLAFIMLALIFFDKERLATPVWILLVVSGAALLIGFSGQSTVVGRMLNSQPFVFIGLISYSLYLWHQPLFAFYRINAYRGTTATGFAALCGVTLLFAIFSWRYIELPFRNRAKVGRGTVFTSAAGVGAAFVIFGIVGHLNSGFPERDPLFDRLASNYGLALACNGNHEVSAKCATSKTPEIAFFGNSYAMHLVNGFRSVHPNINVVQLTQDSCSPYIKDPTDAGNPASCSKFVSLSLKTLTSTSSIDDVLISSPFGEILDSKDIQALKRTLAIITGAGKRVTLVGPTPTNGINFGRCFIHMANSRDFKSCDFDRSNIDPHRRDVVAKLKMIAGEINVGYIDLTEVICDAKTCHASIDDKLIFRDSGHLSREGSKVVFERLRDSGIVFLHNGPDSQRR